MSARWAALLDIGRGHPPDEHACVSGTTARECPMLKSGAHADTACTIFAEVQKMLILLVRYSLRSRNPHGGMGSPGSFGPAFSLLLLAGLRSRRNSKQQLLQPGPHLPGLCCLLLLRQTKENASEPSIGGRGRDREQMEGERV